MLIIIMSPDSSTIALSEGAKGEVRAERIEKESYEEIITRVFAEYKILRGDFGTEIKEEMVLIRSLLDFFGVPKKKIQKLIISHIESAEVRKAQTLEEGITTERLKIKTAAIRTVLTALIVSVAFLVGVSLIF